MGGYKHNLDAGEYYEAESIDFVLRDTRLVSDSAFRFAKRPLVIDSYLVGDDVLLYADSPILFNSSIDGINGLEHALNPVNLGYDPKNSIIMFNGDIFSSRSSDVYKTDNSFIPISRLPKINIDATPDQIRSQIYHIIEYLEEQAFLYYESLDLGAKLKSKT